MESFIIFDIVFNIFRVFQLSLENVNVTSTIKNSLLKNITTNEIVNIEIEKFNEFNEKITTKLIDYDKYLDDVSESLDKIRKLEYLVEYFKILQDIQDIR